VSYHLPSVDTGHRAWDAYQAGKPWQAAGYVGLLGIEALGVRGLGRSSGGIFSKIPNIQI